jgi:transposase InsO family protein
MVAVIPWAGAPCRSRNMQRFPNCRGRPLLGASRAVRKPPDPQGKRPGRDSYRTRRAAKADVFDFIGRGYNPPRRHSTLGYLGPIQYQQRTQLAKGGSTEPAAGH